MTQCPVCAKKHADIIADQPSDWEYFVRPSQLHNVYLCQDCGSEFLWPRPNVNEVVTFYPPNYHAYHDDHGTLARFLVWLRSSFRAREYKKLVKHRPIRLFDVGAGNCRQFDSLKQRGEFLFAGVEINPEVVKTARANGYDIVEGTLEGMDIASHKEQYDLVTMFQLVEHVIDPIELMSKAFQLLAPGGSIIGQLPCTDSWEHRLFGQYWAGYHFPRHLQMLSRNGIGSLLQRTGFCDIEVRSAPHLQAGLSLQNLILKHYPLLSQKMMFGKLPIYSLLLVSVTPFCTVEWLVNQGGMMNFRAKKP